YVPQTPRVVGGVDGHRALLRSAGGGVADVDVHRLRGRRVERGGIRLVVDRVAVSSRETAAGYEAVDAIDPGAVDARSREPGVDRIHDVGVVQVNVDSALGVE